MSESATPNPRVLTRLIEVALYAFLLLMPFSVLHPLASPLLAETLTLYVTPGLEAADIPAAVLLLLVSLRAWQTRRSGEVRQTHAWPCASTLLLLGLLGVAGSGHALVPLLALYSSLRWLFAAALVWGIARSKVAARNIVFVLGIGLCLHAGVAMLQVIVQHPLGLPAELALSPGQPGASTVGLGDHRALRGYGLTFHPNVLGGYLAVCFVLLLPMLANAWVQVMASFLLVGLAVTLSRSACLALLLVLPPAAYALARREPAIRRALLHGGVLLGCGLVLASPIWWKAAVTRLNPLLAYLPIQGVADQGGAKAEEDSLSNRRIMNRLAIDAMEQHPALGIGAGNFPAAMLTAGTSGPAQFVHNIPLLLGAEVGLIGLGAWVLLPFWPSLALWRGPRAPWLVVSTAALWAIYIIGLFDCYPWSLNAGRLLTTTVLGLLERAVYSGRADLTRS